MSLHQHQKVTFKTKVYYKRNIKNGKCDLHNIQGDLVYIGISEDALTMSQKTMSQKTLKELALLETCYGCESFKERLAITVIFVNESKKTLLDAKKEYQRYLGVS